MSRTLCILSLGLLACTQRGVEGSVEGDIETSGETGSGHSGLTDTASTTNPSSTEYTPEEWINGEPPLCHLYLSCDQDIPDEPKVDCDFTVERSDGYVLYDGLAGVELRGRSSVGFAKPQYAVELRERSRRLVVSGSTWSYWDHGTDPGSDWTSGDFDDSDWDQGEAPLGYGDDQATVISYGSDSEDKHITTWFRLSFSVRDAAAWPGLTVGLIRDDGGVVYLNGQEILRSNLPEGEIDAGTRAGEIVDNSDENTFYEAAVDAGLLVEGENILSVEVHQANSNSSDLTFDLWLGEEEQTISTNFYDMGGESDWVLNGAYVDRALFRNKLTYDLFQAFSGEDLAPEERYAAEQVFCDLELNGDWRGIYLLGERVKRDDDRVDIQEDPDDLGGSFLVKNNDDGAGFMEATGLYGEWNLVYPREEVVSAQALAGIEATLQSWGDAVTSSDPTDPETGIWTTMDMDSAVDFVLLQEFAKNNDAYFLSIHLWKDLDGKLHYVPWDLDLSFGYPYYDCGWEGWVGTRVSMNSAMASDPDFILRLRERWDELREGPLAEDAVLARIDTYQEVMGDTVDENFEVWPIEEITFEWGDTSWLCPVESYEAEVEGIREFIQGRLHWMDENLESWAEG